MRFSVLGPLEIISGDVAVRVGSTQRRAVLGLLLLNANKVVTADQFLWSLWGSGPPPTARKMLRNATCGLRGLLGAGGDGDQAPALVARPQGYLLRIDPERIDLPGFLSLIELGERESHAARWARAARTFRLALAMWRGPVLSDLAESGLDWPELAAVDNRRLDALEGLFEAELSGGRHREVLGELESLVQEESPRERLSGQLMLCLYRSGRQVDALAEYWRVRTALIEGHGREPGSELERLQTAILNQEPALDRSTGF